jgi:hypothetical protein
VQQKHCLELGCFTKAVYSARRIGEVKSRKKCTIRFKTSNFLLLKQGIKIVPLTYRDSFEAPFLAVVRFVL